MNRIERARALIAGTGGTVKSGVPSESLGPRRLDDGRHLAEVAGVLGGDIAETPAGPCVVVGRTYGANDQYGRRRVGDYPRPGYETLALVGGWSGQANGGRGRVVYFDLETTGLSGGAGTVAFLIGFGWFDGGAFHTLQYLLPTLSAERRMLDAASPLLRDADTLVTFNGKSFDVPVTEARYAFHRLVSPLAGLSHVDLLHPARRLWPSGETRLTALEQTVLGVRRQGDVPGSEIPARYVAFLRGGDPRLLASVLEHNRLDVVSLGLLAGIACEIVAGGVTATSGCEQALGLGRLYEKVGRQTDAVACYRAAAQGSTLPDTRAEALRQLARSHRRERRHDEAAARWRELLTIPGLPPRVTHEASVALAIHHEHRSRDLAQAKEFAAGALDGERQGRRRLALEHRVRRIVRKLDQAERAQDAPARFLLSDLSS